MKRIVKNLKKMLHPEKIVFHVIGCVLIPFMKDCTMYAHPTILLEFCKMMKKRGHKVVLIGYGDYDPTSPKFMGHQKDTTLCDEYVDLDIPFSKDIILDPNFYTCSTGEKYEEERKKNQAAFTEKFQTYDENKEVSTYFHVGDFPYERVGKRWGVRMVNIMEFGGCSMAPYTVFCSHVESAQYLRDEKRNYSSIPTHFTVIHPWLTENFRNFNLEEKLANRKQNEEVRKTVLYMARCTEIKGFDVFMQYVETYSKKGLKFLVCGNGLTWNEEEKGWQTYDDFAKTIKVYPIEKYPIEYRGVVNDKECLKAYRESYVLIQPSQYDEPFGMNIIEAMAYGMPVITTMRGNFIEIVRPYENGYFIETEKECLDKLMYEVWRKEAIKKSVGMIGCVGAFGMKGRLSEDVEQKCREYALKHFSEEVAYEKYMKFFGKHNLLCYTE